MAYPPVPTPSAGFIHKGTQPATLVWGTDSTNVGTSANYIVKSARFQERVEEIDIENGTGFEATVILLLKGENVEFTVVDDRALTPPLSGGVVTLSTPYNTASPYSNLSFLVVDSSVNLARKVEGERIITAKSFTAMGALTAGNHN